MNIWIDIDNPKHVVFYKAIITELKTRGHSVTITAQNSNLIKTTLKENQINAKITGSIFSFFGLLLEPLHSLRFFLLSEYIKDRKIDIAFSLGSKPMFYNCVSKNIPMILLLESLDKLPDKIYLAVEKMFFIIPEKVHDQTLIEARFDLKKVIKCKGSVKLEDYNFDPNIIKELVNKIEFCSMLLPQDLSA